MDTITIKKKNTKNNVPYFQIKPHYKSEVNNPKGQNSMLKHPFKYIQFDYIKFYYKSQYIFNLKIANITKKIL